MHSHDLSGIKKKNAMMDQTSSTVDKSLTKKKKIDKSWGLITNGIVIVQNRYQLLIEDGGYNLVLMKLKGMTEPQGGT